ncbi:putative homeodomain transcription factor isoform X3 [Ceratina calcarata]|uniref:Homeodomain transcription factor isoform X3 n=1 Tax=Ceratina calcarata TaxID=156304 RepID=A0AAJ7N555_9HYME|nr:putative homeodomain transcription factor isoform X3 [Ceratina calcarata]
MLILSEIVSTSEVLIPVIMMLTLCIIHSHIVSTHSGPIMPDGQNKRKTVKRLRHTRCRMGKSRTRQNLRLHEDSKSSQDTASEKASTVSDEVLTSVRFGKKVIIENSLTVSRSQEFVTAQAPCDNEPVNNVAVNNPMNGAPAGHTQSNDVSEQDISNVHQDDDGFESLNGNVSSDNVKSVTQVTVDKQKKNELHKNSEEHTLWLEDTANRQSVQQKFSASELLKTEDNSTNSEPETSNKVDKDCLMGIGSTEGRRPCESEEEGECEEAVTNHLTEATTSATEWMGVTTNSDECSYSSELEESDLHSETTKNYGEFVEHPFSWEFELPPSIMLSSNCAAYDRVSCTIWTRRDIKKAELSVLDISSAIIARVESMPESMSYFYGGLMLSLVLSLIPSIKRLSDHIGMDNSNNVTSSLIPNDLIYVNLETYSDILTKIIDLAFGTTLWERMIVLISAFERLVLSSLLFFLLAVAERTYKQRLLYAKLFSHLTSSRRARKSDLPHFRLNKVRNIKLWLSVRSYLKRRGPQRSVHVIVSAVFIVTLLLLSFVSLELIKDLESLHSRYNVEALFWSFSLGIFILRFMTLGTKINKKYRNLSVLITEQINLYLQIEQKPHKKEELMVANNVLKLAADLIKELECPFKISGLSANPYLYTITKVVLLSALSGVLSELLGFKLKLHKIKIK